MIWGVEEVPTQMVENSFFPGKEIDQLLLESWHQEERRNEVVIWLDDQLRDLLDCFLVLVAEEELVVIMVVVNQVEVYICR